MMPSFKSGSSPACRDLQIACDFGEYSAANILTMLGYVDWENMTIGYFSWSSKRGDTQWII